MTAEHGDRDEEGVCVAGEPSPFSLPRLSAFVDGDLPSAETQSVRQHVEACAACARRAGELAAVSRAVRGLEAPEPPPTLWPAIEGALARQERAGWLGLGWRTFGLGALAGGAVAAVVSLGWGARAPAPPADSAMVAATVDSSSIASSTPVDPLLVEAEQEFERAAGIYEHSIEKLRGLLAREETRFSPDMRARTDERLARLDEAITRSREAARRTPGDSVGNEQLFAAYQQKIAFLTETVHRGGGWGPGGP
jgi:hypothetical protein